MKLFEISQIDCWIVTDSFEKLRRKLFFSSFCLFKKRGLKDEYTHGRKDGGSQYFSHVC